MAKQFSWKNIIPKFLTKGNDSGTGWTSFMGSPGGGLSRGISDKALMDADKNWVYIATDRISDAISGVPYKLMRFKANGEDEEVIDHPILDVLDKPNNLMSGSDLFYFTSAHMELTGNAYWLHEETRNPTEIMTLLPEYTKIIMADSLMDLKGYDYRVGTFHQHYKPEDVLQLKSPNPRNPVKGRGTLANIAEWVDVDSFATEFNRKFFINGATNGGALETEATTKEALELAKLGWEMAHKGASNAHKTSILPKGSKYNESKTSQKDMEFNQSLITTRNNILAAFGVPKSVIGISETGDSKSDAESAHFAFMFFTIAPKVLRLEKYLNEHFVPLFDDSSDLFLKFDDPVPANNEAILERRKVSTNNGAWVTVNEVRAEDGLEPLEGGDELKDGGSTFSLSAKSKKFKNKRAPFRRMVVDIKKEKTKESTKKTIVDAAIAAVNKVNEETKEEQEETLHKQFIERTEKKVDKLADNFKDHDRKLKEKLLAALENVQDPAELKAMKKSVVDDVIDRDAAVKATIEFSDPILQDIIKAEGAERYNEIEGVSGSFDPKNERIQKILERNMKLMAASYNDTTIKILETKLAESIAAGDTMVQIRNMVSEVFDFTEKFRAQRIAHTEVFRTANMAGREAFKQSGVVTSVKWHTAADEKVCEYCEPMNGRIVGIDDSFFDKGEKVTGNEGGVLDLNYDDIVDPPLHVSCRCFTLQEDISIGEVDASRVTETKEVDNQVDNQKEEVDDGEKKEEVEQVAEVEDDEEKFLKEAIEIMQHDEKEKTT